MADSMDPASGGRAYRRIAAVTAALAVIAGPVTACSSPRHPAATSSPDPAAQALAYSRCMRGHGIHDFPDPQIASDGKGVGMALGRSGDLDPQSPAFKAADQACRSLQPGGANGDQGQSAQELAADVKFARCMRSHGYPSFPDPDGRGTFNLSHAIDMHAARFDSAADTCRSRTNLHSLSVVQK